MLDGTSEMIEGTSEMIEGSRISGLPSGLPLAPVKNRRHIDEEAADAVIAGSGTRVAPWLAEASDASSSR
jgi:hypothetical protein